MASRCGDEPDVPNTTILFTVVLTFAVTCCFLVSKTTLDRVRQRMSRVVVVVIGAGPVGLTSLLIAARSGKVSRIIVFEERCRHDLVGRAHQIAIDAKMTAFLQSLGVDFDNIEGCREQGCFFTRSGVFIEYMLSIIQRLDVPIDLRLNCKFTREYLKELDAIPSRVLAIVSDGQKGHSARLLGVSDEFVHHSCKAYGAVATVERFDACSVPTPEVRVHNLTFDLSEYGYDDCTADDSPPEYFHMKIFGNARYRYLALAVPRNESKLVKVLKVVLDQSVMRNIFKACHNVYKPDTEPSITDNCALRMMKFNPRLFEVKLSQRMVNVTYIEDVDFFVVTEGEAARWVNFHSGMNINLALKGLQSLGQFIRLAASAQTEKAIDNALLFKFNHARSNVDEYLRSGLRETMYT